MSDIIKRKEIRTCLIEDSDAISKIGYIEADQLLQIEFKKEGKHQNHYRMAYFDGVPVHVYQEFVNAKSVGEYFNSNIKDHFEEVEEQGISR